jgi:hypothetical protein
MNAVETGIRTKLLRPQHRARHSRAHRLRPDRDGKSISDASSRAYRNAGSAARVAVRAATAYSVVDYPDEVAAATAQLSTNAAGFARVTIRPLLTAEDGSLLVVNGELAVWSMVTDFAVLVLLGNIVGGTALFALISYAQVMWEI